MAAAIISGLIGGICGAEVRVRINSSRILETRKDGLYDSRCFLTKGNVGIEIYWVQKNRKDTRYRFENVVKVLEREDWDFADAMPNDQKLTIKIFMSEQAQDKSGEKIEVTKIYSECAPGDSIPETIVGNNLDPGLYTKTIVEAVHGIILESKKPPGLKSK
jgi:hypothetical protein